MDPIGYDKERAARALQARGIGVLVVTTPVNVFYASGVPVMHAAPNPILFALANQFPTVCLVRADGEESLILWMLYQSASRFSWITDVEGIVSPQSAMEAACGCIDKWKLAGGKIALESRMPRYQSEFLRGRFPSAIFVDGDEALLEMRLVKSEEEIRRIRKSTEITEQAIDAMTGALREGTTDTELLRTARRAIVDSGAEGWDHLTLGIGLSDPEAPGSGVPVKRGEICRFDVGAVWQGYVSDISRHATVGPAPKDAAGVIETLCQVQDFCVGSIKPSGSPKDTYTQTAKFFKSLGRRGTCHVTGHSIGLECEELHLFSPMKKADMPFQENMVLDIEVWQYFEGAGLIGVEDCYRVTATGCERISSLPREIREM